MNENTVRRTLASGSNPNLMSRTGSSTTHPTSHEDEGADQKLLEVDVTAKRLINQQMESQKKRNTVIGCRGSNTRTSLWSTIVSNVGWKDGKQKFFCAVCRFTGAMNKNVSTRNIIECYNTSHQNLSVLMNIHNKSNASEEMLVARMEDEKSRPSRRRNQSSVAPIFQSHSGSEGTNTTEVSSVIHNSDIIQKLLREDTIVMSSCTTKTPYLRMACPMIQDLVNGFGVRMKLLSKIYM